MHVEAFYRKTCATHRNKVGRDKRSSPWQSSPGSYDCLGVCLISVALSACCSVLPYSISFCPVSGFLFFVLLCCYTLLVFKVSGERLLYWIGVYYYYRPLLLWRWLLCITESKLSRAECDTLSALLEWCVRTTTRSDTRKRRRRCRTCSREGWP